MVTFLVLFFAQVDPAERGSSGGVEANLRNQANWEGNIVEPPRTMEQFRTNLRLKYHANDAEKQTKLFMAYLGKGPWPDLIANISTSTVSYTEQDLRVLLVAKKKRMLTRPETALLESVKANLQADQNTIKQEESGIALLEKGKVSTNLKTEVQVVKGAYVFRSERIKADAIAVEKEILAQLKAALAAATKGKGFKNPQDAKFKPQTLEQYKQAYDEADFWLQLASQLEFLPASVREDLEHNKVQKKFDLEKANEDPKLQKPQG